MFVSMTNIISILSSSTISRRYFVKQNAKQTFAVVSVEERHEDNSGLLLFPLKHIAVPWPVFLLQDFVVYRWERLLYCICIGSGKSQGLKGADGESRFSK